MARKLNQSGFTTIELIVVLIVVAVLIGVVAFANKGVEARNRNQDRTVALKVIQTQLEAYYQQNNHYPSRRDMNDDTWLRTSLQGFDPILLKDPMNNTGRLADQPTANQYAYQPLNSKNASCEEDNSQCSQYTLTATLEGGGQYVKQNNN